jgi:hypothetical protein
MTINPIIYDADDWRVIRINPIDFRVERHYKGTDHVDSALVSLRETVHPGLREFIVVRGPFYSYQLPAELARAMWHAVTHGLGIRL